MRNVSTKSLRALLMGGGTLALALSVAHPAAAQDACSNRGQLDTLYCDENKDLVADSPKDPKRWRDPSTLVWAYTPVEDPAVYANIFKPFTDHLEKCVGKRTVYYPVQSNSAEIEAMRSGRLHFAGEHCCYKFVGYMEGALQSGIAAARNVREVATRE